MDDKGGNEKKPSFLNFDNFENLSARDWFAGIIGGGLGAAGSFLTGFTDFGTIAATGFIGGVAANRALLDDKLVRRKLKKEAKKFKKILKKIVNELDAVNQKNDKRGQLSNQLKNILRHLGVLEFAFENEALDNKEFEKELNILKSEFVKILKSDDGYNALPGDVQKDLPKLPSPNPKK